MLPGEIVIVRHRGEVFIGVLQGAGGQKIKVATGNNRLVESPADRMLHRTGIQAGDLSALDGFRDRVEKAVEQIDLGEVWRVLKEEPVSYTATDIAELYWGNHISAEQYAAVLLDLSSGNTYFAERDDGFVPLDDERVEAALNRIASQQAAQAEMDAFLAWIRDPSDADSSWFNNRQKLWLTRIRQFVILGEEYEQSVQAKTLLAEIKGNGGGDLRRYGFSLLVDKGMWDPDEHLDLIRYSVPVEFDAAVLSEAADLSPVHEDRADLTSLVLFSIDDAATLDVDDALSVEQTSGEARIGVHIADVSAIVPRGSLVDAEARQRLTSLYFPDLYLPMIPPCLSQGHCSLLEGERRLALSFLFSVDRSFSIQAVEIVPSMVINQAKLSYQDVDRILASGDHPLADGFQWLSQFVDTLYAQRIEHGAIEVERNEVNLRVDREKRIEIYRRTGDSTAEHIVSEMMILTNAVAAKYFAEHAVPAIFRTQVAPELKGADEQVHEAVRKYLILRQIKPVEFGVDPKPHAMLGVDRYCQITSPIRRYTDLVLQRQLIGHLRHKTILYDRAAMMDEMAQQDRARELNRILSRRDWYWLLTYFARHPDLRIRCVVLEIREREIILDLIDYGVRASITPSTPMAVGDEIMVKIVHADAWTGVLRLAPAS